MIKAGEWRLGVDEEPKTFQIVRVKAVTFHPAYNPTNLNSDVALLHLEEKLRYDTHIGPICVDDEYVTSASTTDCLTTGWGKEVLRSEFIDTFISLPQVLNRIDFFCSQHPKCSDALRSGSSSSRW